MALTAGTAHAITREQLAQYASSLKGKKKAELKTALYQLMNNGKRVLSYGAGSAGTWWGFYVTDRDPETNQVINRYSSDVFYFGKRGEAPGGMNIEQISYSLLRIITKESITFNCKRPVQARTKPLSFKVTGDKINSLTVKIQC